MDSLYKRVRCNLLCAVATMALSACGGGDAGPPEVLATADDLSITIGRSASLLANDSVGGSAADPSNADVTLVAGSLPAGVSVAGGTVNVAATALPATFTLTYRLCEAGSDSNCATTTARITVPSPVLVAAADAFSLAAGNSGDVLANDTVDATPASAATVVVAATAALPGGVTLSAGGVLGVDALAAAGTYAVGYRICQVGVPANCATATATVTVTVPVATSLSGRAVDSATGAGVAGVSVSAGSATATTDASGNFALAGTPVGERVTVLFRSTTHAESARVTALSGTGTTGLQVRLVRVAATVVLDAGSGGTATVPGSTARVTLPGGGLQRADGSVPTGNVSVALTPINPSSDSAVMPGDFTTLAAGVPTPIESFGALNVQLADAAGAPLQLRSGQTATLRIPVASRNAATPATIALFHFDTASGRWVQEGTATLAGGGAAAYYEGSVSHFSTWNADQVYNTVLVTGCLAAANGTRVAGALVVSDGIDYSGITGALTDTNGNFTIPIRRGSSATLAGASAGLLTNTLRVGPFGVDTSLPACLGLGQTGAGITIKLTWGALPSDLDSQLFTPSGTRVYFGSKGNLSVAPFANLDVDDLSSFGPEVVTVTRLMVGTYKYSVNNFSGYAAGSLTASGARVELNLPGRGVELFAPPAGEPVGTRWWNLFEFDVDAACAVTVRRVASYSTVTPTAPTASTPVYCTPP